MPQCGAHPLRETEAVPHARIVRLRNGRVGTITRVAWPRIWVVWENDVSRQERPVWRLAIGLAPPGA